MKNPLPQEVEKCRILTGVFRTTPKDGANGLFVFRLGRKTYNVVVSDGGGWEHVSVSVFGTDASPAWDEMCAFKDLFWESEECVVQFHPPRSEYVNFHKHTLHLWKPVGKTIETPPTWMVGPK